MTGGSKAYRATITDVRVGSHLGYDRLVLEMNAPITSYILEPHDISTFVGSFSGIPVKVLGNAGLILHAYNQDYPASFPHGTNIVTGFSELLQVVVLGDFEGQADIAIGLAQLRCPKVYALSSPYRLVIDFPT